MLPWILPTSSAKDELANAFWIMPMTIRPGAMNVANGTPMTSRPRPPPVPPSATVKMTRNNSVVIAGAQTVCICTLKKRRTSFKYNVFKPPRLTFRMTGTPGSERTQEDD